MLSVTFHGPKEQFLYNLLLIQLLLCLIGPFILDIEDAFIMKLDKEIYLSTYINHNYMYFYQGTLLVKNVFIRKRHFLRRRYNFFVAFLWN